MEQPKPLSERTVVFRDAKGEVAFEAPFVKLDLLLYQWQQGLFPKEVNDPGAHISKEMGWERPLTMAEVMNFANQMDKVRVAYNDECQKFVCEKTGSKYVPDTQNQKVARFNSPVPQEQEVPVQGEARIPAVDLLDIACMVAFILRGNPDLESWGLLKMQEAGCSKAEIEEMANRMVMTRPRR